MKKKIDVGVNNYTLYVNDANVNLFTKTLLDFL
jgi:hypothetical protein